MVKHVVCWKIKEFAFDKPKSENLKAMQKMLLSLKDKIEILKELEVGINSPKADPSNYDIILTTSFRTFKDLNLYQAHPEHKKVAEFIGKIREFRTCIDYEY
jgi:hypothetical protein